MTRSVLDHVPVIDFSESRFKAAQERRRLGEEIDQALTDVGFFYAANHGVPESIVGDVFAASSEFYKLSDDEKNEVTLDRLYRGYIDARSKEVVGETTQYLNAHTERMGGREMFTLSLDLDAGAATPGAGALYGPNNWPKRLPTFKTAISNYFNAVTQFSEYILRGVAIGMGVEEQFFSDKFIGRHLNNCTLLHYLPLDANDLEAGVVSGPSHTDISLITCLYQDNVGGLQARPRTSERWIDVPPIPNTFVINSGDLLARWTNGRYEATPHRVVNYSGRERYSIAIGCYPRAEVVVDPRNLKADCEESAYPPAVVGEHLHKCFVSVYGPR